MHFLRFLAGSLVLMGLLQACQNPSKKYQNASQTQPVALFPGIDLQFRISQYDHSRFSRLTGQQVSGMPQGKKEAITYFLGKPWKITYQKTPSENPSGVPSTDVSATLELLEGTAEEVSFSMDIRAKNWDDTNYVLMPAAAYNGNRFTSRRIRYSPKLLDPRDIGKDVPTIISDVPRLRKGFGPSRIQQRSGDMATPSAGYYSPGTQKGFFLLTGQGNQYGDHGISLRETRNRDTAFLSLTSPVVREVYRYKITDNRAPSPDKGLTLQAGDKVKISAKLYHYDSQSIQALYDTFFKIRKDFTGAVELQDKLPFSAAFQVQEPKYNAMNWVEEANYYAVGSREFFLTDWQMGWTGGMLITYPLLVNGSKKSFERVRKNFEWFFPDAIAPSGLPWAAAEYKNGQMHWYGGDIRKPHTKNWHLTRRSGDALYYLLKQLRAFEDRKPQMAEGIPPSWRKQTQGIADALVKIWEKEGQLGQFIHNRSGEVIVGGSTSGGVVPAGLALAAQYYEEPRYLKAAEAIADHYYQEYVTRGLTTGGPGDALQNPDSESAYALIESFTALYEQTGKEKWLQRAEEMARQFSSWVISYNYRFPESSLFGQESMNSVGAVFANTQNKHGAPGICTHSGVGLFKLYRFTGNERYLELIREIAHNMTQYVGHPKKPIKGVKDGWICERVSTTDWNEGIGEITYMSTWAEVALMMSFTEIPGIYVEPHKEKVTCIDHVDAEFLGAEDGVKIKISNPTKMDAKVRVLVEGPKKQQKPLGFHPWKKYVAVEIKAGQSREVDLKY